MLGVIVLLRRVGVPTHPAEVAASVLVVPPWFWATGRAVRGYGAALRARPENRAPLDAVSAMLVVMGLVGAAIFQIGYLGESEQLRYVGLAIAGAGWIAFFLRQPARPRGRGRGRQA
jgi:hypothetical protein